MASKPYLLEIKSIAKKFSYLLFLIFPLIHIATDYFSISEFLLSFLPICFVLVFYNFIMYDVTKGQLVKYDENSSFILDYFTRDPEVCVIGYSEFSIVVPMSLLRTNDIIIDEIEKPLSVTYCVLCNSIHSYYLPKVNDVYLEIDSNNGNVLNGNKILTDKSRQLIWQQLNGKPLNEKTAMVLTEISNQRMHYQFVSNYYEDAKIFVSPMNKFQLLIFRLLEKLVQKIPRLSYDPVWRDHRLPMKMLVEGLVIDDTAKAYPHTYLDPHNVKLFEDRIGSVDITLISNHGSLLAIKGTGFELRDNFIEKGNNKWDLFGFSLSDGLDLEVYPVSNQIYWNSWVKSYPKSEIYTLSN